MGNGTRENPGTDRNQEPKDLDRALKAQGCEEARKTPDGTAAN